MIYKTKNPVLIKRNNYIRKYYEKQKDKYSTEFLIENLSIRYKLKKHTIQQIIYKSF